MKMFPRFLDIMTESTRVETNSKLELLVIFPSGTVDGLVVPGAYGVAFEADEAVGSK